MSYIKPDMPYSVYAVFSICVTINDREGNN